MQENKLKLCSISVYPSYYRENIYKRLDSTFDCTFVFGDEPLRIKKIDYGLLNHVEENHVSSIGKMQFQWGLLKYLFKKYDYYLLNANTNNITIWIFLILLKFSRHKKSYLWVHGLYGKESNKQLLVRKMFYNIVDGLFLYGDYARNLLIGQGLNEKKLHVIHNSLDYEKQLQLRQKMTSSDIYKDYFKNDNPVIVMIGRLNDRKKLDLLFDAMMIMNENGHKMNATIIGDGDYREHLEDKVKELKLEGQVWFYGACYDEKQNAELLYNSDISVIPGDVGLSAIHSMMFGVPVITHDYYPNQGPEFEVIKEGVTGSFYDYDNISSLANKIVTWFETHENDRDQVRKDCFDIVDREWNPIWQMDVFKSVFK